MPRDPDTRPGTSPRKPTRRAAAPKGAAYGTATWFAQQVLTGIGAPLSVGNVAAMKDWMAAEGGHWNNSATYNPLNTTQPMPGYSQTGSQGNIGAYTSWEQGVAATVKTILNGKYKAVVSNFHAGNGAGALQAVVASPWGTRSISAGSGKSYGTSTSGGGGGGGGGGSSSSFAAPKAMSVGDYVTSAAGDYGYLAAYLKDPELGPILARAAKEGWSANKMQAAISKTKWWKHTSQTQREWDALKRLDHATARQQNHDMQVKIGALAKSEGVSIDADRLNQMADHALGQGWTDLELRHAVAAEFHYNPKVKYTGTTGTAITQLKSLAGSYLVPLSDHTLGEWTTQILDGTQTAEGFTNYLKEQAKSLYPYLSANLDAGMTTLQYADPYRQVASNLLGINPNAVDFTKPQWQAALTHRDEKGQRVAMTLSDWQTKLMSDASYGYDKSPDAAQKAADFAGKIAATMGATG